MRLARLLVPSERRKYCAGRRGRIDGLVRRGDGGFSVVEIIVAMGVFALVATFMAQTLGSGLRGVLLGKRREVATQVANEMMEKARSLSFNAIGHISPLEPDPAIESGSFGGEPLVFVPDVPNHPFDPHLEELTRGSTSLTRYIYITWATDNPGLKRISVRVEWNDAGTQGGQNEVRAETLVNESGLIPTGRAGMPLTGKTFASGGFFSVQSSLLGLPVDGVNITLPTSTGASTFRAVQNVTCTTKSTSIQAAGLNLAPGYSVTTTADDDPRTATLANPPPQSKSGVIWENPLPPPLGTLLSGLVNSPVECEAGAESLASEAGTASAASLLSMNSTVGLNLQLLGINLITWPLNLATLQTLPVEQEISHEQSGASRQLHASSSTGFESIRLLDLPVLDHGVVRLDAINAAASVTASDTPGGGGASVDTSAFTLRVLDATNSQGPACGAFVVPGVTASRSGSYCVVNVNTAAAGFPGLTVPIQGNLAHHFRGSCVLGICVLNLLGGILRTVDLGYSINLSVLPPASSPVDGEIGPNGERRWIAEHSPISVSAELTATLLGVQIINAAVDLDLGTVRAEACSGTICS